MPQIKEYTAPRSPLSPSDKGMQEWEIVGRRAGPLYNAAAQDVRERAKLAADEIEGRDWTLNYLVAYRRIRDENAAAMEAQRAAMRPPEVRIQFGRGRSGNQYPGGSSESAGGRVDPSVYATMSGAVGLSQIAGGKQGSKGGKIAEPPTFQDDIQRELASDPYSFDDLMKRLTGSPMPDAVQREAEAEQAGGARKFEDIINDPLGTGSPSSSSTSSWWSWMPSFGVSGDNPLVTEGREDIQ